MDPGAPSLPLISSGRCHPDLVIALEAGGLGDEALSVSIGHDLSKQPGAARDCKSYETLHTVSAGLVLLNCSKAQVVHKSTLLRGIPIPGQVRL